jgi:uncharacterized NAD-dependent epimerase/dehydratase family protein
MSRFPEGNAIVYCEGAFGTTNGKTAHGLVRRSERYRLVAVIDSRRSGRDAGEVLDGAPSGVPVVANLAAAVQAGAARSVDPTHFVVGLAPDGGRLGAHDREAVREAIRSGLHVDCGLHDFLSEDPELVELATVHEVLLRDVRKPPPRSELHFFAGKIDQVGSARIAMLGTDSAVGKRTTAWMLVDGLRERQVSCELIGTGQTAWMQGAPYGIILDSLVNDFVSGEIEHAIWRAWSERQPQALVLEGQGSLMNPAYPGGFELLAAGRPQAVVLQHAPGRAEYDGFPGFTLHPIEDQIRAVELISGRPVVAITVNHEGLDDDQLAWHTRDLKARTGLPVCDPLRHGVGEVLDALGPFVQTSTGGRP